MRLFLGVFLPEEIIQSFVEVQEALEKYARYLRFVDPVQLHLTLRFFGDAVSEESATQLLQVMKHCLQDIPRFNLRIKEACFGFANQPNPRILFVSISTCEQLNQLISRLNSEIEALSLPDVIVDKREPHYHITLARAKHHYPRSMIKRLRHHLQQLDLWEGFQVSEILLMQSVLKTQGSEYAVVRRYKLEG